MIYHGSINVICVLCIFNNILHRDHIIQGILPLFYVQKICKKKKCNNNNNSKIRNLNYSLKHLTINKHLQ